MVLIIFYGILLLKLFFFANFKLAIIMIFGITNFFLQFCSYKNVTFRNSAKRPLEEEKNKLVEIFFLKKVQIWFCV